MNKHIAILLLFPATALAQPTITNDIVPHPGDVIQYVRLSTGQPIMVGPGQYWDLLGQPHDLMNAAYYAEPDTVPCGANYPDADLALLSSSGAFAEFYRTSDNAWAVIGFCGSGTPNDYLDPFIAMTFPWTYGDSWEDPYSLAVDGEPLLVDTVRWIASAWGTLRLPGGLEMEVVGQQYMTVETDTVGSEIWTYLNDRLDLFSPGMHSYVARFYVYTTVPPSGMISTSFSTYALDEATLGLSTHATSSALEFWPVPAHEVLNLRWPRTTGALRITITDAMGRVVQEGSELMHANAATIRTGHLPPGTYLVQAIAQDGKRAMRMITVE